MCHFRSWASPWRAGAEPVLKLCGCSGGISSGAHPGFAAPIITRECKAVATPVPFCLAIPKAGSAEFRLLNLCGFFFARHIRMRGAAGNTRSTGIGLPLPGGTATPGCAWENKNTGRSACATKDPKSAAEPANSQMTSGSPKPKLCACSHVMIFMPLVRHGPHRKALGKQTVPWVPA